MKNVILMLLVCLLFPVGGGTTVQETFDHTCLSSSRPFFQGPPYRFQGNRIWVLTFKTDPAVLKKLVPAPLTPVPGGTAAMVFSKLRVTEPGELAYFEAFLSIPVSMGETMGRFVPVLYLNKAAGIIPGREIWGYNKVGADITFSEIEPVTTIQVISQGKTIIKAVFTLGAAMEPGPERPSLPVINRKYIPAAVKGEPPVVDRLVLSPVTQSRTGLVRPGTATLEFFGDQYNPLDRLPVHAVSMAVYLEQSYVLPHGRVLYDYRHPEK